jgi:4-amino-4-deoxy-L-arabinose transferase-like glycosyltransferase
VGRAQRFENAVSPRTGTTSKGTRIGTWALGAILTALATGLRLAWVLSVPTVPVSDFAMYRESANWLSEFGSLDHGFIYMPGFVWLLSCIQDLGGDLLAQKMAGVAFGGLGAAGLFALTLNLFENRAVAVVATLLYATWPAGVAMTSVVGTDVPAAALLAVALGLLAGFGPRRPWLAALLFGAAMGLAAWVRAVALPLTALSLAYWLARRTRWPAALARTALAVAATLLVLLPWGVHHVRKTGHLYFTDDHGGITALIGANPNSEGTYTRALNQMFLDLSGRGVLDEPHRETDRAAYALAREWTRFAPRYTLGLAAKRAERLFEPESRLLYWSIFRPGVLVGQTGAWFHARRAALAGAADAYGIALAALALAGVLLAALRRRLPPLSLVPFQLALTATYVLFFAEPRYRLPIRLLAFPFVALALVEVAGLLAAIARRDGPEQRRAGVPLLLAGAAIAAFFVWLWPAAADAGATLRARHRWAADVWRVEGRPRLAKWRGDGADTPRSPVEGGAGGVRLLVEGGRPTVAVVELSGGPLPSGLYTLSLAATATAPAQVRVTGARNAVVADVAMPAALTKVVTLVVHEGGDLRLSLRLTSGADAAIVISDVRLTSEPAPADPQ